MYGNYNLALLGDEMLVLLIEVKETFFKGLSYELAKKLADKYNGRSTLL